MTQVLVADFSRAAGRQDRRGPSRRRLRFESLLTGSRPPAKVVVLDLSQAGLMLHSPGRLEIEEAFEVELPESGPVEAQVVWRRNNLYGCKFLAPVSRGIIGAVMLRAQHDPSAPSVQEQM
jgi:hypothetical protein